MKRDGLVITVERRGISSGIALRHLSHPQLHIQSAKDHNEEETALQGVGTRGQAFKTISTAVPWRSTLKSHPSNSRGTLGINICGGPIS